MVKQVKPSRLEPKLTRIEERFWKKVGVNPFACWEWKASLNGKDGYGMFWNGRRTQVAHRFLYESLNGAIPKGFELDHLCRNKKCVSPFHLEVVTRGQNTARGIGPSLAREKQLAKTHCPRGHEYTPANTYIYPDGRRNCRICSQIACKKWRLKNVKSH